MALADRRAADGGAGGDGHGRAGGEFCYFVVHVVPWTLADQSAPSQLVAFVEQLVGLTTRRLASVLAD